MLNLRRYDKKSKRRSSGAVTTGVRLEGIQKSFKVGTNR